jgi:hypothetical protein
MRSVTGYEASPSVGLFSPGSAGFLVQALRSNTKTSNSAKAIDRFFAEIVSVKFMFSSRRFMSLQHPFHCNIKPPAF